MERAIFINGTDLPLNGTTNEEVMFMSSMEVNVGGFKMKNPLMIASGPISSKLEHLKEAEENGFAAVSLKHTMAWQKFEAKPRWFFDSKIGVIVSGDPRLEPEYALDLIRKAKEQTELKIAVNLSGIPNQVESWGELSHMMEQAGADAIELNFNCPNLLTADAKTKAVLGANLGADPDSCRTVVAAVKQAVKIPVIAKLNTESGKLMPVSKAVAEAGADILNVHASYRSAPGLDIYHGGKMLYPGSEKGNFGAISGPWSKRASDRFICDVYRSNTGKAVIGGSGLYTWRDVVETIMYGASAVQMCVPVMQKGFGIGKEILDGLGRFMDECGYRSIDEMVGLATKYVCAPGEMDYGDITALVDETSCVGCRQCMPIAHCDAITYDSAAKKCAVDEDLCVGCGFCRGVCPKDAITYVLKKGK